MYLSDAVSVMYVVRNQMQTGIRQNRKRLFKQKVESQVVRFAQHKITRQKSLLLSLVVTRNQICRQDRIRKQNQRVSCTISQQTGLQKSAPNKDQRSDGLTYKLLGVFIHRSLKQATRID